MPGGRRKIKKEAEPAEDYSWVTADHHFFHGAVQRWYPWRAATSVVEMNARLIAAWNAVVHPSDRVLHLGDLSLGTRDEMRWLISRLNGRITLVRGNHDRYGSGFLRSLGMTVHRRALHLMYRNDRIICRHRPTSFSKDDVAKARLLLHGHCHGKRAYSKCVEGVAAKAQDVGIDVAPDPHPIPIERFYAS